MRNVTQRELRNQSGEIMRALDRGESFLVTRNGVPVAELRPYQRRTFVPSEILLASLPAGHIDWKRFRRDIDRHVDQSIEPRA